MAPPARDSSSLPTLRSPRGKANLQVCRTGYIPPTNTSRFHEWMHGNIAPQVHDRTRAGLSIRRKAMLVLHSFPTDIRGESQENMHPEISNLIYPPHKHKP